MSTARTDESPASRATRHTLDLCPQPQEVPTPSLISSQLFLAINLQWHRLSALVLPLTPIHNERKRHLDDMAKVLDVESVASDNNGAKVVVLERALEERHDDADEAAGAETCAGRAAFDAVAAIGLVAAGAEEGLGEMTRVRALVGLGDDRVARGGRGHRVCWRVRSVVAGSALSPCWSWCQSGACSCFLIVWLAVGGDELPQGLHEGGHGELEMLCSCVGEVAKTWSTERVAVVLLQTPASPEFRTFTRCRDHPCSMTHLPVLIALAPRL